MPIPFDNQFGTVQLVYDNEGTIRDARTGQPIGGVIPDPLYANIIPRQDTLANLLAIASGDGEIAVATDTPAIVVLANPAALDFGRIPVSALTPTFPAADEGQGALTLLRAQSVRMSSFNSYEGTGITFSTLPNAIGGIGSIVFSGGDVTGVGNAGGEIQINGGDNLDATEGYGGSIIIQAGLGGGAGVDGEVSLGVQSLGTGVTVSTASIGGAIALGFFGGTPAAKPTVTGSRGGNAALASLLTALATLGLITNNTTA